MVDPCTEAPDGKGEEPPKEPNCAVLTSAMSWVDEQEATAAKVEDAQARSPPLLYYVRIDVGPKSRVIGGSFRERQEHSYHLCIAGIQGDTYTGLLMEAKLKPIDPIDPPETAARYADSTPFLDYVKEATSANLPAPIQILMREHSTYIACQKGAEIPVPIETGHDNGLLKLLESITIKI